MVNRKDIGISKYTRLILFVLLCIASVCGQGQTINGVFAFPNPGARGIIYNGIMPKNELYTPIHDTTFTPVQIGAITKRPQDTAAHNSLLYTYTGTKWDPITPSNYTYTNSFFDDGTTGLNATAEAQTSGGVLYNLLDTYTGEHAPFKVSTVKTHADVDGVIVREKGGVVYERVFTGKANAAWFGLTANGTDQKTNFDKIFAHANVREITIPKGVYKLSTSVTFAAGYSLAFEDSACISVDAGVTVSFRSKILSDYKQYIFNGAGNVDIYETAADRVSVCWFGAKPSADFSFDSHDAFQKAITSADRIWKVYVPGNGYPQPYYIGSTVELYSPTFGFSPIEFYGDGFAASGGNTTSYQRTTRIIYGGTSKSLLNITGARSGTYIHDLSLEGLVPELKVVDINNKDVRLESYWIGTSYNSTDTLAHSAITTDGASSISTKFSQNVRIERCSIIYFVVGINVSARGGLQGDQIFIRGNNITRCGYAISFGNAQNRSSQIIENQMDRCYTAFTNRRFGLRTGSRFSILAGQVTNNYRLFYFAGQVGGNSNIDGLYCENVGVMGQFGLQNNSTVAPYILNGCTLKFRDDGFSNGVHIYTPFYDIEVGGANVTFNNCTISSPNKVYAIACNQATVGEVRFNGCVFNGSIQEVAGNQEGAVTFENCQWQSLKINQNRTIRLDYGTGSNTRTRVGNSSQFVISATNTETISNDKTGLITRRILNRKSISLTTCTINSDDSINVNITWPSALDASFGNLVVGDFMWCLVNGDSANNSIDPFYTSGLYAPALEVTAIDYTARTITIKRLGFEAVVTSTSTIYAAWRGTVYSKTITGSITNGSPTVTGINNILLLAVGDAVTFEKAEYTPYRVSSIDTAGTSITLTQSYLGKTNSVATISSAPVVYLNKDIIQKTIPTVLTDASTVTIDAGLGNNFILTLGGNRTLAAPTNPTHGQRITLTLVQDGTGSRTITWNSAFKFNSTYPQPTLTVTANKDDIIDFQYSTIDSKWECIRVVKYDPTALPVGSTTAGDLNAGTALGDEFIGFRTQTASPPIPATGIIRVFTDSLGYLSLRKSDGVIKPIIKDVAEQDYAGTPSFSAGTAPTSLTYFRYKWSQVGKIVTLWYRALYATPGATVTILNFALPTDMPIPEDFSSLSGNEYEYTGAGSASTASASTQSSMRVEIRRTSSVTTIVNTVASGSLTYFKGTITYRAQ